MPICDILLHVDGAKSWTSRAAAATSLARDHDAHLIGLAIKSPFPAAFTADGVSYSMAAELEAIRQRDIDQAAGLFNAAVRAAGLEKGAEWRVAEGDQVQALATHARYVDLTIVSQGDPAEDDGLTLALPGDLALAGGRPVLVVPFVGAHEAMGRRVLVAWNGTREAARAVADSMMLLQAAEEVVVLTVSERGMRETAGQDLARHLARHGVRAEVEAMAGGEVDPADILLNLIADRSCDMLVMGCYGHSRLREAILGGVSRNVLRGMTVPVLLSH